jgi:hypothetical protein
MTQTMIQTYTGRFIDPLDPDPEQINTLDICHHLSQMCRFAGATREFYSVAEHSCRVFDFIKWMSFDNPNILKWAILHDAPEAYLLDLPAPVKQSKDMSLFREIEKSLMWAICERFNLPREEPQEVYYADKSLLVTEQRDLMPPGSYSQNGFKPLDKRISPWNCVTAKSGMIERLEKLGIEVKR